MELKCYVYPGWQPRLRAAASRRDWMDAAPESFPYRCLPLAIANAHGWEILSPCGFEAYWNGGPLPEDVVVTPDPGTQSHDAPVALFGQGTITFHIQGLFRTDPGWNIWVGGPPNSAKDGIAPLSGIIETDWAPYTFTMNWRFTRPRQSMRFEENEPFAFIFPIERNAIETVEPHVIPMEEAPDIKAQFEEWSRSRDAFQKKVAHNPPKDPKDKWQKLYYRGVDAYGGRSVSDHKTKLRLPEFKGGPEVDLSTMKCPVRQPSPAADGTDTALRKREWILQTQERLRALSPLTAGIYRKEGLGKDEFLEDHYAVNRPVILSGMIDAWPALHLWTPQYLKERVGSTPVEIQANRGKDHGYERDKERHRHTMAFDAFIEEIVHGDAGNRLYMTAYNSSANRAALAPLTSDLGFIDTLLSREADFPNGMMWIGPEGTFTPLHHDLTNNLLVQLRGRKRILLCAPAESGKLYNDHHVFSRIADLRAPDLDMKRYPLLENIRFHEIVLDPGEILFLPVGWWHQVLALDFSISATYTNFCWPNDAWETYPSDR